MFARSAAELATALAGGGRLVLLDLTGGLDYDALFRTLDEAPAGERPPVVAFTTHALAARTKPWHARCARVVTKETLTQELPTLLRAGTVTA